MHVRRLLVFLCLMMLVSCGSAKKTTTTPRAAAQVAPTNTTVAVRPFNTPNNMTATQIVIDRWMKRTEIRLTAESRATERASNTESTTAPESIAQVPTAAPTIESDTSTPTSTLTALSTDTQTPRPTEIETQTLYATGNANLRPCTKTTSACAPAGAVSGGQELTVLGQVDGDTVSGSKIWYKVLHNGQELYIHSSLVSATRPVIQPTRSQQQSNTGGGSQSSSPANTPIVASTIEQPPVVGASCPGFDYTCPQLTCEQAYACLAAGNGRLDADKDGKPCETQCGG